MAGPALERVLQRLHGVKPIAAGQGNLSGYMARCPVHDDKVQSLQITERSDLSVGLHCHAGCAKVALVDAMGLTYADLFSGTEKDGKQITAEYNYRDINGVLLYQAVRYWPKAFSQRRPNGSGGWINDMHPFKGKHVPYRLNDLKGHNDVVIVEGEKDADRLWDLGIPATTNIGGAKKWGSAETKALVAAGCTRAFIIADNDEAGHDHAVMVGQSIKQAKVAVSLLELPDIGPHGDVSDWLANGGTKEALQALMAGTPYVVPPAHIHVPPAPPVPQPDALPDPLAYRITTTVGAGAAEAFRDRYQHRLRYDHTREKWFIWDQHRWRRDDDEEVIRLALQHSRQWGQEVTGAAADFAERKKWQDYTLKLERAADRKSMLTDARIFPPFYGRHRWDADPWLLGVPNGVVDLRTGLLRDGQQSDFITLQTGCSYDPDAQCPRWLQFMDEVFEDAEVVAFLQRFCGYCLTGRTSEQLLVMCYGQGRNGKGRLWAAMRGVMGEYAAVLPFSSLIAQRKGGEASNDLAAIQGKRLVTASEVNEGARLNEARIKSLTGEDPITARFLYAEFGTFDPMAKFVLAVNSKPVVRDDSYGFWRRVRLVPFNNKFDGDACDPKLDQKLEAEWPGILTWAVQGCLDWQHSGRLPEPAAIMDATKEYEQDSDPLEEFLSVECEDRPSTPPTAHESATAMFTAYVEWCDASKRSKEDRLSSTAFGLTLSKKYKKARGEGGRFYYHGIRLKPRKSHLPYEPPTAPEPPDPVDGDLI